MPNTNYASQLRVSLHSRPFFLHSRVLPPLFIHVSSLPLMFLRSFTSSSTPPLLHFTPLLLFLTFPPLLFLTFSLLLFLNSWTLTCCKHIRVFLLLNFLLIRMVKLSKVPCTPEDFNNIVTYLQFGTFPVTCYNRTKKSNFTRWCKNFTYDNQNGYLYYIQPPKDENSPPTKKRVVLTYDKELREVLFEKFHVGAAHFDYHKTYKMIYEQHIGITQEEVERYVRNCPTCIRNTSIKEKQTLYQLYLMAPLNVSRLIWWIYFLMHNITMDILISLRWLMCSHIMFGSFHSKTKKVVQFIMN